MIRILWWTSRSESKRWWNFFPVLGYSYFTKQLWFVILTDVEEVKALALNNAEEAYKSHVTQVSLMYICICDILMDCIFWPACLCFVFTKADLENVIDFIRWLKPISCVFLFFFQKRAFDAELRRGQHQAAMGEYAADNQNITYRQIMLLPLFKFRGGFEPSNYLPKTLGNLWCFIPVSLTVFYQTAVLRPCSLLT